MVTVDDREQFAYTASPEAGTVSVIDLRTLSAIREIRTHGVTLGLALSETGVHLYAATRNNNAVAVIDVRSGKMLRRWFIQGHPVRLAILPGRNALLSAQVHTGDLAMISLSNGSEVARMPVGKRVNGLVLDRQQEHAYVSAAASNIVMQVSLRDWKRRRVFRTLAGPDAMLVVDGLQPDPR